MFILKDEATNTVFWGPKHWDKSEIQSKIYQKYDLEYPLPYINSSEKKFEIEGVVSIFPVIFRQHPVYDKRVEFLDGPFYEYSETHAHQYYEKESLQLEQAKNFMKSYYSSFRYEFETGGVVVEINENKYLISTKREEREVFFNGSPGAWKLSLIVQKLTPEESGVPSFGASFSERYLKTTSWVTLSEEELSIISTSIKNHVQLSYDYELALTELVNSAQTKEEITTLPYTLEEIATHFDFTF